MKAVVMGRRLARHATLMATSGSDLDQACQGNRD